MASRYCCCLSLAMCVYICLHEYIFSIFVRVITHHPVQARITKFGPGVHNNLVEISIFSGVIDLDLQDQIELQSQNLPYFELVHAVSHHHQVELEPPILCKRCETPWLSSLLFWGWLTLSGQIQLLFKVLFVCITFASLKYLWDMQNWSVELFHVPHGSTHVLPNMIPKCTPPRSHHGPWYRLGIYI